MAKSVSDMACRQCFYVQRICQINAGLQNIHSLLSAVESAHQLPATGLRSPAFGKTLSLPLLALTICHHANSCLQLCRAKGFVACAKVCFVTTVSLQNADEQPATTHVCFTKLSGRESLLGWILPAKKATQLMVNPSSSRQ